MKPFLLVLSAPSGGGKSSIARNLLQGRDDLGYSVSATTRPIREGERDGVDYYFLSREEFVRRREAGEFLEWATYGGHLYGTLRSEIERANAVPETRSAGGGSRSPRARRAAVAVAAGLVVALAVGFLLPEPYGLAAETVVNQPLAEAQASEARRQAEIERLLAVVAADPRDADALSDLADAYLAGSAPEDLQRAALVLLALIGLDGDDPAPYGRLITAYIRAQDWPNASSATDALAELAPDSPDVPFFRGLIAWQGHGDAPAAIDAFDEFLTKAPDDPRVPMIRALRAEAASEE